jgi:hypothetical protein
VRRQSLQQNCLRASPTQLARFWSYLARQPASIHRLAQAAFPEPQILKIQG